MEGVLYVSHGSRVEEARKEAESFLHKVHEHVDVELGEVCFLELAKPTIGEGVERLVKAGATKIAVIPVLLLRAGHYYKDVPQEIEKAKQKFPFIEVSYGEPLGVQDRIVDVLVDRIASVPKASSNVQLLLVGRGSLNPETKQAIGEVTQILEKKTGYPVENCYLAACSPTFEEGLQTVSAIKAEETIVVPYLWFTGLLIQSMEERIEELHSQFPSISLSHYLQDHPIMVHALKDRVDQALEGFEGE